MSDLKTYRKGEYIFRESDTSDSMFLIKQGRVEISRKKGESEVVLAEKKTGEMLGEMAFFDGMPRSANAKALIDTQVIALPFKSLHAQYEGFPDWLKAIVRTITTQLRQANTRIKNLEQTSEADQVIFTPHLAVRLLGILSHMATTFGKTTTDGKARALSEAQLLRHTIQVFSAPTHKMEKLLTALATLGQIERQDLGEGRFQVIVKEVALLHQIVADYSEFLFKEESKRVEIGATEVLPLQALSFYARNQTPDSQGLVTVNLTEVQTLSPKDLGKGLSIEQFYSLGQKKVTEDIRQDEKSVSVRFHKAQIQHLFQWWQIIHFLLNYKES